MLDTKTATEALDYRKSPFIRVARMDDWCSIADGPTDQPFMMRPKAHVCRSMLNLDDAKEYAEIALAFFAQNDVPANVYVICGPTSTTKRPYEVVTETCGYRVAFKAMGSAPLDKELTAARHLIFGHSTVIRANETANHRVAGPVVVRFDREQGWHYTRGESGEIGRDLALLSPIRRDEAVSAASSTPAKGHAPAARRPGH